MTSPLSAEALAQIHAQLDAVEGEAIEAIHELFSSSSLPEALFHGFVCDCAARALAREEAAGRAMAPALQEVLEGRRSYLAGALDDEAMDALIKRARREAHAASVTREGYEAATAAADAGSDIAYAARAIAWAVAAAGHAVSPDAEADARLAESRWQVEHLRNLLTAL